MPELGRSELDDLGVENASVGIGSEYNVVNSFHFAVFPSPDADEIISGDVFDHEANFLVVMEIHSESDIVAAVAQHSPHQLGRLVVLTDGGVPHYVQYQFGLPLLPVRPPHLCVLSTLIPGCSCIVPIIVVNLTCRLRPLISP